MSCTPTCPPRRKPITRKSAARDVTGAPAETMLLYGLDDIRMRRMFIEDEDSTEDRKRREHKRLDALIAYCEAPECRRRMLLGYFGEIIPPCGNCDVCLDPVETLDGTNEARMALAAVDGTGHRFGATHIVQVLRGGGSEKIAKFGHDRLAVYGAGTERSAREWQGILRQMVASGLLRIDIAGHGGLSATQAGTALMRGDGSFRFRPDRLGKAKAAKRSPLRDARDDLAPEVDRLFGRLKAQRLAFATELGVPAYVVFPDRTLLDMAMRRPRDRAEFAQVHGVGESKLRKFADAFLDVINAT